MKQSIYRLQRSNKLVISVRIEHLLTLTDIENTLVEILFDGDIDLDTLTENKAIDEVKKHIKIFGLTNWYQDRSVGEDNADQFEKCESEVAEWIKDKFNGLRE